MSTNTSAGKQLKEKFTSGQTLIFVLCLIAYSCAYLNRLHLSIALPSITESLGIGKDEAGIITMSFFWTYAIGQLVSGWLGDRIPPKYMIGVGLGMSSLCCFILAFMNDTLGISLMWALNGVFQSMLWAPIMKVISNNFTGAKLQSASFGISFSLVIGHMIAWASSSAFDMVFANWRIIFIVPAVVVTVFVVVWFILFKEDSSDAVNKDSSSAEIESGFGFLKIKYMPAIFLILMGLCLTHGIVKEGVGTWFPTLLKEFFKITDESAIAVLIIVPVINFAGLLLTKFVSNKTGANSFFMLTVLYVITVIATLILYFCQVIPLVVLVLIILLEGLMYATNPVLTTFIPVSFTKYNCVSTIAGAMDCVIYVGAAIATFVTGLIAPDAGAEGSGNWSAVFLLWLGTMVVGLVLTALLVYCSKKQEKMEGSDK
ncbi:MAG: MFS transporter [Clostridia bacterium]|nr:MFS transporter [Clostridia bacterium]